MKISILIPCHNEEVSIRDCVLSCLNQTRRPDQILVVNDGSTDRSRDILESFGDQIEIINIPKATGNKSFAQEIGLQAVTGDVFIATDGDTELHSQFVEYVEENFNRYSEFSAIGGYVRSVKYNWLTACRAFEYSIGQNLHKFAQHHLGYVFVIPGAAGVFRTEEFLHNIPFEHDTLTEDLDFTYRLHKLDMKIMFDPRMIVYTKDPTTLKAYINQVRRWFGGGWQCLMKHHKLAAENPRVALELSILYAEGVIFSVLFFVLPFISLAFYLYFLASYLVFALIFASFAAWRENRWTLVLVPFPYVMLVFINAYVFLEQMVREVILRKRNLVWFQPERFTVEPANSLS